MTAYYIIAAANGMYSLIGKKSKPKPRDLASAAQIGCEALSELVDDQDFFHDFRRLNQYRDTHQFEFDQITGIETQEIDCFKQFLRIEKRVLIAGGINPPFAKALADQSLTLIDQIRKGEQTVEILRDQVEFLRQRACNLAKKLHNVQLADDARIQARRRVMHTAYGVGGFSIISLNAAILAGTNGLNEAGSAVSQAMGNALISLAIAQDKIDSSKF